MCHVNNRVFSYTVISSLTPPPSRPSLPLHQCNETLITCPVRNFTLPPRPPDTGVKEDGHVLQPCLAGVTLHTTPATRHFTPSSANGKAQVLCCCLLAAPLKPPLRASSLKALLATHPPAVPRAPRARRPFVLTRDLGDPVSARVCI